MQFTVLLCIALVLFIIAVARQTIVSMLLSSMLWFAMSFITYIVSDPTSGLTQGSSALFFGLGVIMFILTIKAASDMLMENSRERQRRMEEEIII